MTAREAKRLLRTEKEIIAMDHTTYVMLLSLGLYMLHHGYLRVATTTKGF